MRQHLSNTLPWFEYRPSGGQCLCFTHMNIIELIGQTDEFSLKPLEQSNRIGDQKLSHTPTNCSKLPDLPAMHTTPQLFEYKHRGVLHHFTKHLRNTLRLVTFRLFGDVSSFNLHIYNLWHAVEFKQVGVVCKYGLHTNNLSQRVKCKTCATRSFSLVTPTKLLVLDNQVCVLSSRSIKLRQQKLQRPGEVSVHVRDIGMCLVQL